MMPGLRSNGFAPRVHRRRPEGPVRSFRSEMALDVEGILDGSMRGEKSLRRSGALEQGCFAGKHHEGFLNLRNGGLVPALPADAVVELRTTISAGSICPTARSGLPSRVETFLQAIALSDQCAYLAARTSHAPEKRDLVKRALAALPYAKPIPLLDDLTDAVLQATRSG